jgi:hypothetical protein
VELAIYFVDCTMHPPPDSLLRTLELDSELPGLVERLHAIAVIVTIVSSSLDTL